MCVLDSFSVLSGMHWMGVISIYELLPSFITEPQCSNCQNEVGIDQVILSVRVHILTKMWGWKVEVGVQPPNPVNSNPSEPCIHLTHRT